MTAKQLIVGGLSALLCVVVTPRIHATDDHDKHDAPVGLLKAVREATQDFRDVKVAMGAGYASLGSCVTGPERGAMGIHYANGGLIMDGVIDASTPELLIYEQRGPGCSSSAWNFSCSPTSGMRATRVANRQC